MLNKQRQAIDHIDREIVRLFEARAQWVEEVAKIKYDHGLDILDSSREDRVIEKVQSYLSQPDLKEELADWYRHLMQISKDQQKLWMSKQDPKA